MVESVQEGVGADDPASRRQEQTERLACLLLRAQAGERKCLSEIVAELTPLLWNVARGQGLAKADAEDVVQAVWLSLVSRLAYIQTPQALTGWLVTAAKREAQRTSSGQRRTRALDADELTDLVDRQEPTDKPVEEQVLARERRQMVRDALIQLPPHCTALLRVLSCSARPDYGMVAEALGMPRGSIGPNRGRCLKKLRTVLINDPRWSDLCP